MTDNKGLVRETENWNTCRLFHMTPALLNECLVKKQDDCSWCINHPSLQDLKGGVESIGESKECRDLEDSTLPLRVYPQNRIRLLKQLSTF